MATMTTFPTAHVYPMPGDVSRFTGRSGASLAKQELSTDAVCDLIAAAGPLTLAHIAAGLGVPERIAETRIRSMLTRKQLKEDEFDRYRLSGTCAA
jgi:hypothetical protein